MAVGSINIMPALAVLTCINAEYVNLSNNMVHLTG